MDEHDRKDSINVIKPLYYLAKCFALVPPYQVMNRKLLIKNSFFAIAYTFVIVTCFVTSLYFIIKTTKITSQALFLVFLLSHAAATFQYVLTVLISAFSQNNNIYKFISHFYEVDKQFPQITNNITKTKNNRYRLEVITTHLAYFLFCVGDLYFHIQFLGVLYFVYNRLLKRIEMYVILIATLLMYNYCLCIKLRFQKLNLILKDLVHDGSEKWNTTDVNSRYYSENNSLPTICSDIRKIRVAYNLLTNMVLQFSTTFGFQILFLYVYIGIVVLEVIGNAIHSDGDNWSQLYFFDAVNTIMGIVLAVTCQMCKKESEETITVCYNLLLHIPADSNNKIDRVIRKELILLAQEATDQGPRFSAAGFFPIDYSMLFGLIGTVTSYVVVLIQVM